ncbi:MAG TPA: glycosyl transferase, partial [Bacteroidales bacterium]|nr:glycosyl transferase [Bacteroidales bacterium]
GYKVAVTKQNDVWCIHDCGLVNVRNGYEEYRRVFLQEYSREIFPLVSILIPAYNQTKYLKEAIESAINQTYLNIEIIIGDDSTNDDVHEFLIPYLDNYKNLTYFKNERKAMDYGASNGENLFKRSS